MNRLDRARDIPRQLREQLVQANQPVPVGGCTKDTARCSDARSYKAVLRDCCKAHLRKIVTDCAEVFDKMKVTWWADYGTLLGAVRNPMTTAEDYPWLPADKLPAGPIPPGIVPHDKDADFGILGVVKPHTFHYQLCRMGSLISKMGYQVVPRLIGRGFKVRLSAKNHTNADFFVFYPGDDGYLSRVRYLHADNFKGRDFRKDTAFPLGTVEWEGMTLPAPKDPAAFCSFRYGPDWMYPIPKNHGDTWIPKR